MRKNFIKNDAVFFITGCSSGFGREMAISAAERGFNIVATARDIKSLDYLAGYKNVLPVKLDITKTASIKSAVAAAVKKFGKIDVLINNAGINYVAGIMNFDPDKMQTLFDTNIVGLINTTCAVLPHMPNNRRSAVVNFSSIDGLDVISGDILYGISKHAVNGLTQGLRHDKNSKIRAMSVNPGRFETNIRANSLENIGKSKSEMTELLKNYRSKPFGNIKAAARDIIDAIAVLKKLPMYMVIGRNAMRRHRRLIRKLRRDRWFLRDLSVNKGKSLLSRIWHWLRG